MLHGGLSYVRICRDSPDIEPTSTSRHGLARNEYRYCYYPTQRPETYRVGAYYLCTQQHRALGVRVTSSIGRGRRVNWTGTDHLVFNYMASSSDRNVSGTIPRRQRGGKVSRNSREFTISQFTFLLTRSEWDGKKSATSMTHLC